MKNRSPSLLPMTLAAGLIMTPLLAFAQADGTPGNPPSTAVGRAVDRATGNPTVPDGAPGNPPGTAAGRAIDRATGPATTAPTPAAPGAAAVTTAAGSLLTARPRISQIIGSNIYNERDDRIGEVEDVIFAMPGSNAQGPIAVLQIGGFLGLGGRLVAVPMNDLRWNSERSRIEMPGATKEALQSRAPFEFSSLRAR